MSRAKAATRAKIQFPAWVPQAAEHRISELWATPLGLHDRVRAFLERLATYPVMKTDVWEKLPHEPAGVEPNLVDWSFFAFTIFPNLRRPYPKTAPKLREWAKHIENYPPLPEPAHVSGLALMLWEEISKLKTETDFNWTRLWQGDRSITTEHVLSILDQLRLFYLRMDDEYRALLTSLPKIKRWNDNAAQKFFAEYLSRKFKETYGQPFDSIVAALTEVAFDLVGTVDAETIRGRRRIIAAPEKSSSKTR
jgi:hypothetical protein